MQLSEQDGIMANIINRYPGEKLQPKNDAFYTLIRSITGQQISVKAADSIWNRLCSECIGDVTAENITALSADKLRLIGYSKQKIIYLRSVAEFFIANPNSSNKWHDMTDEEVIRDITTIKGIGRWTAEMFLIFHLQRPDILPVDDIGLLKAAAKFYNNDIKITKHELRQIAEKWRPWRSVATWYLWRALDGDDVVCY